MFMLAHPIVLFFYYLIVLFYMNYLSNHDFNELIQADEYHELIYFRDVVKDGWLWIFPLAIYLTAITYFKFFSLYSLKFLLERPSNFKVFRNVITTTLYHSVIIQSIFQSLPQIIFQALNNLLIMEDRHDFKMRGVFNFSTIFSLLFMSMMIVIYMRDRKDFSPTEENKNTEDDLRKTAYNQI
jgi:hypothetical protein